LCQSLQNKLNEATLYEIVGTLVRNPNVRLVTDDVLVGRVICNVFARLQSWPHQQANMAAVLLQFIQPSRHSPTRLVDHTIPSTFAYASLSRVWFYLGQYIYSFMIRPSYVLQSGVTTSHFEPGAQSKCVPRCACRRCVRAGDAPHYTGVYTRAQVHGSTGIGVACVIIQVVGK
jgi:hypothetical protein